MSDKIDQQTYSISGKDGITNRAALYVRRKIFKKLSAVVPLHSLESVLDVGVTANADKLESNFFENWYPNKDRITALSDQDAHWLEQTYPGLRFVQGDGRAMPFADNSFDFVFSSAVLEHVGSYTNPLALIKECWRVSRQYIFLQRRTGGIL